MNRSTAGRVLVLQFLLLAFALPTLDYRGADFFITLGVLEFAPFVVVALVLMSVCIWGFVGGISDLRRRQWRSASASLTTAAIGLLVEMLLVRWCTSPGTAAAESMAHSEAYHALCDVFLVVLIVLAAVLLLVVPLWAIGMAVAKLASREGRTALQYIAVPLLGLGCNHLGSVANDRLTLRSCAAPMRSALQDVKNGTLPLGTFRSDRPAVLKTNPDIVVCPLDDPPFLVPEYIAYDSVDSTLASVSSRIAPLLDGGQCKVRARRVERDYYWVDEDCP